MAGFQPGKSGNPRGRPKGAKNKATEIKTAFFDAFDRSGGIDGLLEFINENKTNRREFYRMLVQMVPKELDISTEPEEVERMSTAELVAIASEGKIGNS